MTAHRLLPAFGRELIARRLKGFVPASRTVALVDNFDVGLIFRPWRAVIKDDQDPAALDLSFVAGLGVVVIASTPERVVAIATAARAHRAKEIVGAAIEPGRIMRLS